MEVSRGDRIVVRATAPEKFSASRTAKLTLSEGENAESAAFVLKTAESTFTVEPGVRSLTFRWGAMARVDHFELHENPDGNSGFTKIDIDIPGDVTETTLANIVPHLMDWNNAQYQLHACVDTGDCAMLPQHEIALEQAMSVKTGQMLKAFNAGRDDKFGFSIALSADEKTLAIGARGENALPARSESDPADYHAPGAGAVYVYEKINGKWQFSAYIKPEVGNIEDQFGYSVALNSDGTVLAVGAQQEDGGLVDGQPSATDNSLTDSGAAYVFRLADNEWQQEAYLKSAHPDPETYFGASVALDASGNTLVAGSYQANVNGLLKAGALEVFVYKNDLWNQETRLVSPEPDSEDYFGHPVVINSAGNRIVVGAISEDGSGINGDMTDDSTGNSGAAFVFDRDDDGTWKSTAYLKAENAAPGDNFGASIAMNGNGNVVAIGAWGRSATATDGEVLANVGTAYVFETDGKNWTQAAYLESPRASAGYSFAWELAISGDGKVLAVPAIGDDSAATGIGENSQDSDAVSSGAIYIFHRDVSGARNLANYSKATNTGPGDFFGYDVAISRDGFELISGAFLEDSAIDTDGNLQPDDNSAEDSGAVYIY